LISISDSDKSYVARSEEYINNLIEAAKLRQEFYYGKTDTYLYGAIDKYSIANQHVLIMGSNIPWYESICIAFEAASCTTVDYNQLHYDHPKTKTYTVGEFSSNMYPDVRKVYDRVFSISSFEHDGLGRYGDPLNPDADLDAMKDLLQYTHPETLLYLAVPVGSDVVVWNSQRIYGSLRLPLLLESWEMIDRYVVATTKNFKHINNSSSSLLVLDLAVKIFLSHSILITNQC